MLTNVVQQFYLRPTNNYLRTSSNTRLRLVEKPQPRATLRIQMNTGTSVNVESIGNFGNNDVDGVNNARARYVGNDGKGIETIGPRCFNCKEIGHIARNCTSALRKRSSGFYKEAMLLAHKGDSSIDLNEDDEIELDTEIDKQPTYNEENKAEQQLDVANFVYLAGSDTDEPETKLHPDLAQTTWIDDVQPDKETRNIDILSEDNGNSIITNSSNMNHDRVEVVQDKVLCDNDFDQSLIDTLIKCVITD
ncbi:retrovirus-related pol polyprotein from transposon TNT 1-94 [Tanacetum coccineum]|uniref:Retrovirus-related pol polyprotein from transposon TNT 1-94 n=1 Tax=Tanacetum coccineum TaxID=301880 RepID=A0ABQ5IMM5_9ASTR